MAAKRRRKKAKRSHTRKSARTRRKYRRNPSVASNPRRRTRRRKARRSSSPRVLVVASNPRRRRKHRRVRRHRRNPGFGGMLIQGAIAVGTAGVGLGLATLASPHLPKSIQADQRKGGALLLGVGVLGLAAIKYLTKNDAAAYGFGAGVGGFGAYELVGGVISAAKAKKEAEKKPAPAPSPQLPPPGMQQPSLPVIAPTSIVQPVDWAVEDYDPTDDINAAANASGASGTAVGGPSTDAEDVAWYQDPFQDTEAAPGFWGDSYGESGDGFGNLASFVGGGDETIARVTGDRYVNRVTGDRYINRVTGDRYINRVQLDPFS